MKKNKIIMWMDKSGKYFACHKIVSYKLSFDKLVENCGSVIESEDYNDIKEAKAVAKQVVLTTDLSCVILKSTKYKSAINGNTKEENLEVAGVLIGKNERLNARQKLIEKQSVVLN